MRRAPRRPKSRGGLWLLLLLSALGRIDTPGAAEAPGLPPTRTEIRDPAEIRSLRDAAEHPSERAFWQGRLEYLESHFEAAVESFRQARGGNGDEAAVEFWLGRSYGQQARRKEGTLGRAAAARRSRLSFEKAIALDGEYLQPRLGLVRFHLIAPSLVGGDRREAYRQAREIAARDPYLGNLAWGGIHEEEERWDRAKASYRRAARVRPEVPEPALRLVWMLQTRGRFEEAFQVLEELFPRGPEEPLRLYELGRTAAFSGLHLAEGLAALESFLDGPVRLGDPSPAKALFHLGMIHRHLGENRKALTSFRRALSLDADSAEARRNMEELERLIPAARE